MLVRQARPTLPILAGDWEIPAEISESCRRRLRLPWQLEPVLLPSVVPRVIADPRRAFAARRSPRENEHNHRPSARRETHSTSLCLPTAKVSVPPVQKRPPQSPTAGKRTAPPRWRNQFDQVIP